MSCKLFNAGPKKLDLIYKIRQKIATVNWNIVKNVSSSKIDPLLCTCLFEFRISDYKIRF